MPQPIINIEYLDNKHADHLQVLASDKAVSDTTSLPYPYPSNGAIEFIQQAVIKRQQSEEFIFAVINNEQKFVGTCGILKCNFESRNAILGYWIGKPYWGFGYATAAACKAVSFAFDSLKLDTLITSCIFDNTASIRVLEKIGFIKIGESGLSLPKWTVPKRMIDFELKKVNYHIQQ